MALITANTSRLSITDKCVRGTNIIQMSTDNPHVPGNAAGLAAFSAVQDALVTAHQAVELAKITLRELLVRQEEAEKNWDRGISQFASLTEALANGDPSAILSTGFGVRGRNARSQHLPAPTRLSVSTNGVPGRTELRWGAVRGATFYLVEMSLDITSDDNFRPMATSTRASCEVDGAEPGKAAWFRVAAVNPAGPGPWSQPIPRPVV